MCSNLFTTALSGVSAQTDMQLSVPYGKGQSYKKK